MPMFRSKSGKEYEAPDHSKEYKMHTANIHDPILSAVNEAQPFEQAADHTAHRRPSYLSNESNELKDIFGQSIRQGDMSNPTRSRNERPLDTIRGFEYAITGDLGYRDQLETNRLGWGFHEDFSHQNLNPDYQPEPASSGRPAINFNDYEQPMYANQNYSASSLKQKNEKKSKKKGGLFGRKK